MSNEQEDFKLMLKDKGLKVTKQRIMVLKVLSENKDTHLTADEICRLVKEDFPEIGIATVYRTIQLLLELNLIDSINLDDGYVRYEIAQTSDEESRHHHHHLICLKCGKIMSFQDDLLDNLEKRITQTTSFQVLDHELKFYGYCKECARTK